MENQEKSFAAQVVANETQNAHEEEIRKTRVGGLGGSDANMVLRIAERGVDNLSATDLKRLCVMLGITEQADWGGNTYTQAGHAFEDYAEKVLPFGEFGYEREYLMSADMARNFKTFAHADFAMGGNRKDIIECKYVQKATQSVRTQYHAQLQWYYMLGAESVHLYHGTGSIEPFEAEDCILLTIERDQLTIDMLLQGIKILDDAIDNGWTPQPIEKEIVEYAPAIVQDAFRNMVEIRDKEKALADEKAKYADILRKYCEDMELTGILDNLSKHQLLYTKAVESKTFDTEAFLRDYTEFRDNPNYWKTTKRKSSVSIR